MKLDEARIALRPRKLSELLDLGLRLSTSAESAARLYAKLGLVVLAPAWGLCLAARWVGEWGWLEVWILALGLLTVTQGVYTVAIGRAMFAREVTVLEVLGATARRLPAYLGALALSRVVIALGCLMFVAIVPPAWAWARVAYVHEACLLEQAGPLAALQRSSRMVTKRVMVTIGLLLALALAGLAFVCVAELVINEGLLAFVLQVGRPLGALFDEGGSAAALLGLFVAVPYLATVRFLAYIDLRTRRDGWDVQLRFMAIAAEAEARAAHGVQA